MWRTERGLLAVLCLGAALLVVAGCDSGQPPAPPTPPTPGSASGAPPEAVPAEAAPADAAAAEVAAPEAEAEAAVYVPVGAISEVVPPGPDADPFLTEEHFVMRWRVLGPFAFGADDFGGGDQQAAADELFVADEAGLTGAEPAPEGTYWHEADFQGNVQAGQVDLDALYDSLEHAAAYAVAYLECPTAMEDLTLWTGSDDYIKVWINGALVHSYGKERRGSDWDQDEVPGISLKQGYNRVVVKCVDVVGGWDFYFRLEDVDQNPYLIRPRAEEVVE